MGKARARTIRADGDQGLPRDRRERIEHQASDDTERLTPPLILCRISSNSRNGKGQPLDTAHARLQYEDLRPLNRGGLGEILSGWDRRLDRHIAIKVMQEEFVSSPERRDRFLLEAQVTSQLDHPGIAPVYAYGETKDGRPFYAMRLVKGETLDSAIARLHSRQLRANARRTLLRTTVSHLASAAQTLAYAHSRRIVNGDVKPANMMLGLYGETLVLDWGEAIIIEDGQRAEIPLPITSGESPLTEESRRGGGTLQYMPPERLRCSEVTPATDVYGLGCCLYKLLTGRDAFRANSRQELMARILTGDFDPPQEIRPQAERGLCSICLKAMQFDPRDRYPSALAFAQELDRWVAREPVRAHTETRVERLAHWGRRHRATIRATVCSSLVLLVVVLAIWTSLRSATPHDDILQRSALRQQVLAHAESIGLDIENRWRTLERLADAPIISQSLTPVASSHLQMSAHARNELESHLKQVWRQANWAEHAESLLLLDARGTVVAGVPCSSVEAILGRNLAHCDCFHGQGRDLSRNLILRRTLADAPVVTVSSQASADHLPRLQFSVPVTDGSNGVIGRLVLGMRSASDGLLPSCASAVALVDLRPSNVDRFRDNLVLHHPAASSDRSCLRSISSEMAARLRELVRISQDSDRPLANWSRHYRDPVRHVQVLAACAPIRARRTTSDSTATTLPFVAILPAP